MKTSEMSVTAVASHLNILKIGGRLKNMEIILDS